MRKKIFLFVSVCFVFVLSCLISFNSLKVKALTAVPSNNYIGSSSINSFYTDNETIEYGLAYNTWDKNNYFISTYWNQSAVADDVNILGHFFWMFNFDVVVNPDVPEPSMFDVVIDLANLPKNQLVYYSINNDSELYDLFDLSPVARLQANSIRFIVVSTSEYSIELSSESLGFAIINNQHTEWINLTENVNDIVLNVRSLGKEPVYNDNYDMYDITDCYYTYDTNLYGDTLSAFNFIMNQDPEISWSYYNSSYPSEKFTAIYRIDEGGDPLYVYYCQNFGGSLPAEPLIMSQKTANNSTVWVQDWFKYVIFKNRQHPSGLALISEEVYTAFLECGQFVSSPVTTSYTSLNLEYVDTYELTTLNLNVSNTDVLQFFKTCINWYNSILSPVMSAYPTVNTYNIIEQSTLYLNLNGLWFNCSYNALGNSDSSVYLNIAYNPDLPVSTTGNYNYRIDQLSIYTLQAYNSYEIRGSNSQEINDLKTYYENQIKIEKDNAFNRGYNDGLDDGYNNGYDSGYNVGYSNGIQEGSDGEFTLRSLLGTIFAFPLRIIVEALDVELFGINLGGLLMFIMGFALVSAVIGIVLRIIRGR